MKNTSISTFVNEGYGTIRGYLNEDGTAYLNTEDVSRGLGFTTVAPSGNTCIRWNTVHRYLVDFGVATSCNDNYQAGCPDFIPENPAILIVGGSERGG